ncbi:MAG: hypothetical protein SXA11_02525 [Cyanobacteriota bacterium]|nr:hypothetical protein [Cyanobacteriota bacterium]
MEYSDFTIDKLKTEFNLTIIEQNDIIKSELVTPSSWLDETLRRFTPLAGVINTEKARSEFIIAPILGELKEMHPDISLFSGTEFNVDFAKGLNGHCDFLISKSAEQLSIEAPVVLLVEAKKENLNKATPQCLAEMVAAQIFNQRKGNGIKSIFGVVTTGSVWRFLKLENNVAIVDLKEVYLSSVDKLFGLLSATLKNYDSNDG